MQTRLLTWRTAALCSPGRPRSCACGYAAWARPCERQHCFLSPGCIHTIASMAGARGWVEGLCAWLQGPVGCVGQAGVRSKCHFTRQSWLCICTAMTA